VGVEKTNLWESFRDGVLEACDEIVERRKSERIGEISGGGMKKW